MINKTPKLLEINLGVKHCKAYSIRRVFHNSDEYQPTSLLFSCHDYYTTLQFHHSRWRDWCGILALLPYWGWVKASIAGGRAFSLAHFKMTWDHKLRTLTNAECLENKAVMLWNRIVYYSTVANANYLIFTCMTFLVKQYGTKWFYLFINFAPFNGAVIKTF